MSIWDIRFSGSKKRPLAFDECLKAAGIEVQSKKSLTFDEALKIAGISLDEWITMKGTHIEVGEGGEILHGAQGKFKNINDVPRKTVKQREGESIEQTHERAREVFAKQDAEKAAAEQKQNTPQTDEERATAEEKKWDEYKGQLKEKSQGLLKEIQEIHSKYGQSENDVRENAPEGVYDKLKELNKERNEINWKVHDGTYVNDIIPDTFKTSDMPELTGSEKQIKWANDIRQKFIDKANNAMKESRRNSVYYQDYSDEENVRNYYAQHLEEASSRYWINNRNMLLYNRI